MFNKKIEKLREELRKEMLDLADSREARLRNEITKLQDDVIRLHNRIAVLEFESEAKGEKYICKVLCSYRSSSVQDVNVKFVLANKVILKSVWVNTPETGGAYVKINGNYIEIYELNHKLIQVLTQCGKELVYVDLEVYKKSQKYDEIYNQPVHAVKENNDDQQKEN